MYFFCISHATPCSLGVYIRLHGASLSTRATAHHAHHGDPTPSVPADSSLSLSPPSHHGAQLGRDPTAAGSTLSPWQHVWDVHAGPRPQPRPLPAHPRNTQKDVHTLGDRKALSGGRRHSMLHKQKYISLHVSFEINGLIRK